MKRVFLVLTPLISSLLSGANPIVTLKAMANSKYVCADNGGANALIANRTSASNWEQFEKVDLGNGKFAFKALANGRYVCADNYGNNALIANRTAASTWESFSVVSMGGNKVALKAAVNNKFVCAENGGNSPLIANRANAAGWETFEMVPVGTVTASFYTTSVSDDLDASDRTDFETSFRDLGYTSLGSNGQVGTSALNSLMGRSDIKILYHTGHGAEGYIATQDGGLSVNAVSGINNNTFIAATCLTMVPTTWKSKMNSNCQYLLGYTKVSYDMVDNQVVTSFANEVRNGRNYMQAWYSANVAQSLLSDRWLGYVREGGAINEYSARSGVTPRASAAPAAFTAVNEKVSAAPDLMADQRSFATSFSKVLDNDITMSRAENTFTSFYAKDRNFLSHVPMDESAAIEVAKNWIVNLPSEAVLGSVTPITVSGDSGTVVCAYIVRYVKEVDGKVLKTNGQGDQITLLVNNGQVIASTRIWSEVNVAPKMRGAVKGELLKVSEIVKRAGHHIARMLKHSYKVNIFGLEPCYGQSGSTVVPAYDLETDQGHFIVNAHTGELVF